MRPSGDAATDLRCAVALYNSLSNVVQQAVVDDAFCLRRLSP